MLDVEVAVGCGAALGAGAGAAGVAVAGLGAVPVALAGAVWPVDPGVAPAGPEVLAGALVRVPVDEVADDGCALVSEPGLDAVPGAAWLVEPAVVLAVLAVVLGPPIDCPANWPFAGWLPEV